MKRSKKQIGFSTLEIIISLFIFSLILSSSILISFENQSSVIKSRNFQEIFFKSQSNLAEAKAQGFDDWGTLNSFDRFENNFEESQTVSLVYDYSKKVEESVQKFFIKNLNPAKLFALVSDWKASIGTDTCLRQIDDLEKFLVISDFDLGVDPISDIKVVRGLAYVSVDSSEQSDDDLLILDVRDPKNISLVSGLNTGRGLNSIHVVGRYIFAANDSSINQIQVIDISKIQNPVLISQYRLFGNSSTTLAENIFYQNERIYLGTRKHGIGKEFHVLSFSNKDLSFTEIGSFEISTQVNDIIVRDDYAFLAVPNHYPLRVLDLTDPENIQEVFSFYVDGPTKHGGQTLSLLDNFLVLGRSIGFTNNNYHELFLFDVSNPSETTLLDSVNIKGSVREVLLREGKLIVGNLKKGKEFQIWDISESGKFETKNVLAGFQSRPIAIDCDSETVYVVTEDSNKGLIILEKQ